MVQPPPYRRIDPAPLEAREQAERPAVGIRLWLVLPAALALCAAQAVLCLYFEHRGNPAYLVATQISVLAFAFLFLLSLLVNPLLRLARRVRPLNRAEMMALFAAMASSAGVATFGLVNVLVPLIGTPYYAPWNTPQRGWWKNVLPNLHPSLYITDSRIAEEFHDGLPAGANLWTDIPWMAWAQPLLLWMIFILAIYLMFYALAMLLYSSWAHREKLIFPLAKLPEAAISSEHAPLGALPSVFRKLFFWVGFLLVFIWLGYNAACQAGWTGDLQPIQLGFKRAQMVNLLSNSIFKGIATQNYTSRYALKIVVIFTAIGIGFLLPLEVSFSLWAYWVLGLLAVMFAIWFGYAASAMSLPADNIWETNFLSSMGAGGFFIFALVCLGRVAFEHWRQTRTLCGTGGPAGAGATGHDLTPGGRCATRSNRLRRVVPFLLSFGWGGALLLGSLAVALGWLVWSGAPPAASLAVLALLVLINVGLMRVVAEGGVYWFMVYTGPFHIAKMFGGAAAVSGATIASLMPTYCVLMQDPRAVLSPMVMNSFKMQDETRAERGKFHLVVVLSILFTIVVAVVTLLRMAYAQGAVRAGSHFTVAVPQGILDTTARLAGEVNFAPAPAQWAFYALGAAWVGFSLLMRLRFPWWVHPIGFVMLVSGLMTNLWFSVFIGWFCKRLVVRYGGRHLFERTYPLFIGLIFGELCASICWTATARLLDLENVVVDINRFWP